MGCESQRKTQQKHCLLYLLAKIANSFWIKSVKICRSKTLWKTAFFSRVLLRNEKMSMYVCKTLFKHASLDNYLQMFSTRGVTQIKYIEYL